MSELGNLFSQDHLMSSLLDTDLYKEINPSRLYPDANQPRKIGLQPDELMDIRLTLRGMGQNSKPKIDQPIKVHPADENGMYQIISGERRWRSAILEKLDVVPIIIDTESKSLRAVFVAQLRENSAREDMDLRDKAVSFLRLIEEFGYSQSDICHEVGVTKTKVSEAVAVGRAMQDEQSKYIVDLLEGSVKDQTLIPMLIRCHRKNARFTKLAIEWMLQSDLLSRRYSQYLVDILSEDYSHLDDDEQLLQVFMNLVLNTVEVQSKPLLSAQFPCEESATSGAAVLHSKQGCVEIEMACKSDSEKTHIDQKPSTVEGGVGKDSSLTGGVVSGNPGYIELESSSVLVSYQKTTYYLMTQLQPTGQDASTHLFIKDTQTSEIKKVLSKDVVLLRITSSDGECSHHERSVA